MAGEVKVTREGGVLVFSDGVVVKRYDIDALPDDIQEQLKYHGATQKLRDSYSGYKKKGVNWYDASDAVYDALASGVWERKPENKLKKLEELANSGVFTNKQIAVLKKLGLIK